MDRGTWSIDELRLDSGFGCQGADIDRGDEPGADIGQASYAVMQEIDRCLAVFPGFAR